MLARLLDKIIIEEEIPQFPPITEDGAEEIICEYCKEEATRPESNGYRTDEHGDIICAKCFNKYFTYGGFDL